jgi:hypothetical protein
MEIPLKLKWLGKETGELCYLLAPFHPLIYISPVPHLCSADLPSGFIRLPHKICRVLDLRCTDFVNASGPPSRNDLALDVLEFNGEAQSFSAIYEFYFEVYLKNSAVRHMRKTSNYCYLEPFHSNMLESRFIALIRNRHEDRTVAGLLLRRPATIELDAYQARLSASASIEEADVAIVDVLSADGGSRQLKSLIQRASEWARAAGYSFLSSPLTSALVTGENENDDDWTLEGETITVWPELDHALLYCDLRRCTYLSSDIYYYSLSGDKVCLHYVANVLPHRSGILRLLNSTIDMEKRVYTRHAAVRAALSAAGVECEFLDPQVSIREVATG